MMARRKKRVNGRKIFIVIALIVCAVIGYVVNIVSSNRNLNIFEKAIKDGVLTIQKVLTYPIDFVINKVDVAKEKNRMYDEYKKLQEELSLHQQYAVENEELKKQIEELKSLLDVKTPLIEYNTISAAIIGRDIAYWNDNIIIDKGQTDGIDLNMPVVIAEGLVGKVVKASLYSSTVRLLTANINDKISVKIQNGNDYVYGILESYDIETKTYKVFGISQNIEIKEGSIVTTTGMGDIYPAGIVVGKVSGISKDNFDLSKVIEVKSDVDFDGINYVKVLKRGDL